MVMDDRKAGLAKVFLDRGRKAEGGATNDAGGRGDKAEGYEC